MWTGRVRLRLYFLLSNQMKAHLFAQMFMLFLKQLIDKNLFCRVQRCYNDRGFMLFLLDVVKGRVEWRFIWSSPNVTLVSVLCHGWPVCPPAAAQLAPRPCHNGDWSIVCLAARHASGHRPTGQQVTGRNHQARARLTILLTHQDGNSRRNLQKRFDEANEGWVKEKKLRGLSLTVRGYLLSRTGWHLQTDVQLQACSLCQTFLLDRSWAFLRAGSC